MPSWGMKRTHISPELELGHRLASMSQSDVARATYTHPSHINAMLKGKRPYSVRVLDWLGFERITVVRPKQCS